jgi:hypothetical protein
MLDSLVPEGEAGPLKHHRKHTRKSPSPKASLKLSEVPAIEGFTSRLVHLLIVSAHMTLSFSWCSGYARAETDIGRRMREGS